MTRLPLLFLLLSPFIVSSEDEELTCGIWFAKSTIPGAGLGIFAGKDFETKQSVLPIGDVVIPLVDMAIHQTDKDNFLWDEYTWDGGALFMDREGLNDALSAASPGFGAAVNCFLDLVNVKETVPSNTNGGLHRSQDPGVGGYSTYWNRDSIASKEIEAGNELFASYGQKWFLTREEEMGPVPLKGDLKKANNLIGRYKSLELRLQQPTTQVRQEIIEDVWESFAWKSPWNDTSRVMFALPTSWEDIRKAHNTSLTELKRKQHSRSLEWLKDHGVCGDWITVKPSTLRQAGRGAFARKAIREGEIVAPMPLIHLPYRKVLDMYEISSDSGQFEANLEAKNNVQLLTNYCMGHNESTMLLCPYGTLSNHVNHNQTLVNTKLVWASPNSSNHNPYWLKTPLKDLLKKEYANLAMNLVATRKIEADEEIFLDYGDEWEEAWQRHVETWKPLKGAENYTSAEQLNEDRFIKTEFEAMFSPYPGNVDLRFNLAFDKPRHEWLSHWEAGTLASFMIKEDEYYHDCEVLRRETDENSNVWYTIVKFNHDDTEEEPKKISKIPREAFRFFDRPYTSDMHQANAFRHDMRVPDHLFPEIWRNRKAEATNSDSSKA